MQPLPRQALLTLVVLALAFVLVSRLLVGGFDSPDLKALWTAARLFSEGRHDVIYAGSDGLFLMRPPLAWAETGAEGPPLQMYPYVYPPLWMALLAPLTGSIDYTTFSATLSLLNPALMAATVVLAWRVAGQGIGLVAWFVTGIALLSLTAVGALALFQNQPQILVAFLMMLALERSLAGRPLTAGTLLALAAALKLFPAALAILWLVAARRREVAGFVAVGAALAAASVLLAGWPLHRAFLAEVRAVAATAVTVPVNLSLPASLVGLFAEDSHLQRVAVMMSDGTPGKGHWNAASLGPVARAAAALASLAVVVGAGLASRGASRRAQALLWAAATGGLALSTTLGWCYYFILPLAFAPALLASLGPMRGGMALAALAVPLNVPALIAVKGPGLSEFIPLAGSLSLLVLCLLLVHAAARDPGPEPALHPRPPPL
jgi:alpha-1,2-mannosyltransferase